MNIFHCWTLYIRVVATCQSSYTDIKSWSERKIIVYLSNYQNNIIKGYMNMYSTQYLISQSNLMSVWSWSHPKVGHGNEILVKKNSQAQEQYGPKLKVYSGK